MAWPQFILDAAGKLKEDYIRFNTYFATIKSLWDAHIAGTADKHAASAITNDTVASGANIKQVIDNLSITGSAHDAFVTGSLVDADGVDYGAAGAGTYLNGRLTAWEQKNNSHWAETLKYEGKEFKIDNPYKSGGSLALKGQLHCHTSNSDGVDSPSALVAAYKAAGYDFVSITDHNVLTPDPGVSEIIFIPGVEETNSRHVTAYDITARSLSTDPQTVINEHKANSKLCSIAHPHWVSTNIPKDEMIRFYGYNFTEIYNGHGVHYAGDTDTEDPVDWALSSGKKIFITAVDDVHNMTQLDFNDGWVVVFSNTNDKASILENLRIGNFYASTGNDISISVEGNVITATSTASSNITFIGLNGKALQINNGVTTVTYTIKGDELYVRVKSVKVSNSTVAWSQPIFVNSNLYIGGNPSAKVLSTVNQTLISGGSTTVTFNTVVFDNSLMFNGSTKLVCKYAGKYLVTGTVYFAANTLQIRAIDIYVNGVRVQSVLQNATAGLDARLNITALLDLAMGDEVTMKAYHNCGNDLDLVATSGQAPSLSMVKVG